MAGSFEADSWRHNDSTTLEHHGGLVAGSTQVSDMPS
jgi:hypothetical protein